MQIKMKELPNKRAAMKYLLAAHIAQDRMTINNPDFARWTKSKCTVHVMDHDS